jgi:hypothetical protein
MSDEIALAYDPEKKRGVLTFPNGRTLALSGVSQEQAENFKARHAAEFQRRDCCLSTVDGAMTRETSNG